MFDVPEFLTISAAELAKRAGERLAILPSKRAVYEHFSESIATEIQENNAAGRDTVLILPVGPLGGFPLLVERCNQAGISWKRVHTFNMDEYLDWEGRSISLDHPLSFRGFMDRFFQELNADLRPQPENTLFPEPSFPDAI
ncbi:MAG TPA: glucosamine-6-phosphate isomerase, partial [Chloroflexota bacterium]|nr:glucosamine-6-phosphate isomerase [Chloroflexota bacterium]